MRKIFNKFCYIFNILYFIYVFLSWIDYIIIKSGFNDFLGENMIVRLFRGSVLYSSELRIVILIVGAVCFVYNLICLFNKNNREHINIINLVVLILIAQFDIIHLFLSVIS